MYINYNCEKIKIGVKSKSAEPFFIESFSYRLDTAVKAFDSDYTNDCVWQLITITVDYKSKSVCLYVNGKQVDPDTNVKYDFSEDTLSAQKATQNDYLGGDNKDQIYSFNGIIDEFMVFDKVLTPYEAASLYSVYDESETDSPTDDQKIIDIMLEKLGGGVAFMENSS